MLTSVDQVQALLTPQRLVQLSDAIGKLVTTDPTVEVERTNFVPLLLDNPNYFGKLEDSKTRRKGASRPARRPLAFGNTSSAADPLSGRFAGDKQSVFYR